MEEKFVAFIDVLGFKELVFSNANTKLFEYFEIILNERSRLKNLGSEIQSTLISDSIIISTALTNQGLHDIISIVKGIQSKLLLKGILLRGAISFGEIYIDEENNVVVGKALIKAYELEKKAIYPRVIIDPPVIVKFHKDKSNFLYEFASDQSLNHYSVFHNPSQHANKNDGILFVDYLPPAILPNTNADNVNIILDFLTSNINRDINNINKYIWLKEYILESGPFLGYFSSDLEGRPFRAAFSQFYNL